MTTTTAPGTTTTTATPEQLRAAADAEARLQMLLALGDVNQANAATALYGDSGTGKTSLCATSVEACWIRYHRVTRYLAADIGGFGNKLLRLIRLGICQVYNPTNHVEPFETMEDISLGYWPETILDQFTGYADPNVRLIAPHATQWIVHCPEGHPVRTLTNKGSLQGFSLQCPICKKATTPQNWSKVIEQTIRAKGVQHVGQRIFDSASALQDWAMSDMAFRAGKGELGGEGSALGKAEQGRILSGRYAFGGNSRSHYGFAQNRMQGWIRNARTIPGQVLPPIFTFWEDRATDEGKAIPVFGPKISGSAKTSQIPSWVGNCIHVSKEPNDKGIMTHRMWLVNHTDPGSSIPHLAKTRAEPLTMPVMLEDLDGEAVFTRFSMGFFFDQLEQALQVGAQQDAINFPDAPTFVPLVDDDNTIVTSKDLSGREIQPTARPTVAPSTAGAGGIAGRPAVTAGPGPSPAPAGPAPQPTTIPGRPAIAGRPAATIAGAPPAGSSTGSRPVPAALPPPPAAVAQNTAAAPSSPPAPTAPSTQAPPAAPAATVAPTLAAPVPVASPTGPTMGARVTAPRPAAVRPRGSAPAPPGRPSVTTPPKE